MNLKILKNEGIWWDLLAWFLIITTIALSVRFIIRVVIRGIG